MPIREFRLGGGLNYLAAEDRILDHQLLYADNVVFDDPAAITSTTPPYDIQTALTAGNEVVTNFYGSVQGINDAFVPLTNDPPASGDTAGVHYLFIKNKGAWMRTSYVGASVTNLTLTPATDVTAIDLVAGANNVTYSGAYAYYRVPTAGTLVVKMWGAGGGGPNTHNGTGSGNVGGAGGYTTVTLNVVAGDIIKVQVGGGGEGAVADTASAGGWPNGGRGAIFISSPFGCGSGGASSNIWLNGTLIAVAGGGGGACNTGNAGDGGGATADSFPGGAGVTGGKGATSTAPGYDLVAPTVEKKRGKGPNHSNPGEGGDGGYDAAAGYASGGGGGGGYYGGGGGGGGGAVPRGGGGGSGYLNSTHSAYVSGSTETSTSVPQGPPPQILDASYSASAGRRTGDPNTDTGYGGLRDASGSPATGNPGGHGYVVMTFTSSGGSTTTDFSRGVHPLSAIQYNGRVYLADGWHFRKYWYDKASASYLFKRVGLKRPAAPSAAAEAGTGGSTAGVTYKFGVTFADDVAESNMSKLYEYTAVASGKEIQITIPVDSQPLSSTTKRRVYRSNDNGDAMFYVGEVLDNTGTTFNDPMGVPVLAGDPNAAKSDEATESKVPYVHPGTESNASNKYATPVATDGLVHSKDALERGEVFVSNLGMMADWWDHDQPTTDAEGTVRNLRLLEDVVYGIVNNTQLGFTLLGNAEYWPALNSVTIGRGTGEYLQDIQPLDKDMICYTNRAVYRFRRFGADVTQSSLEKVSDIAGCVSEMGVAVTENHGHLFMSYDGIYQFDGRTVRKISHVIDPVWSDNQNINFVLQARLPSCCAAAKNDKAWFGYRNSSSADGFGSAAVNDQIILCDMTDGDPKFAINTANATSLHRGYDGTLFMGNPADDLSYLDYPVGSGSGAPMIIRTKLFPVGQEIGHRAMPEKLIIDMDPSGKDVAVIVYHGDYNNRLCAFTISGSNDVRRNTAGVIQKNRKKYERMLPFGQYESIGVDIRVTSLATDKDRPVKVYGIGLYDSGAEEHA